MFEKSIVRLFVAVPEKIAHAQKKKRVTTCVNFIAQHWIQIGRTMT